MSIAYQDTILLECSRDQAEQKQDDDASTWTTQLANNVLLLPGDRVNVFNSFVNDSGSGSTNPVEFRGAPLGDTKSIKVLVPNANNPRTYNPATEKFYELYKEFDTETKTIQLKDNQAHLVLNYYKTMDGLSYVQNPRRFMPQTTDLATTNQRWQIDDETAQGRVLRERAEITTLTAPLLDDGDVYGYVVEDLTSIRNDTLGGAFTKFGCVQRWILKNDNSRYTLMRRKRNAYPLNDNVPANFAIDADFFPPYYARDPEFFDYQIYREELVLSVDEGFSSAQNIADLLTKQMRETELTETEVKDHIIEPDAPEGPSVIYPINKRLESKTYKTFAACNETTMTDDLYFRALTNGNVVADVANPVDQATGKGGVVLNVVGGLYEVTDATNREAARYYQGYEFIAMKRPEIYETGTELNDIFGIKIHQDHLSANNASEGIVLDIPYYDPLSLTAGRYVPSVQLTRLKLFFEAQGLYPELFSEENVINMYRSADNPYWHTGTGAVFVSENNARFLHFNAGVSAAEIGMDMNNNIIEADVGRQLAGLLADPTYTQLGNSYYDYRGTNDIAGTGAVFNRAFTDRTQSDPFYTFYNPNDKDVFYDIPNNLDDVNPTSLTYGFAGALGLTALTNKIILYPNKILDTAGAGVGLPDIFYDNHGGAVQKVAQNQKLGFDRHFNAWGTSCITLSTGIPTIAWGSGIDPSAAADPIFQFKPGEQGPGIALPDSLAGVYPDENATGPPIVHPQLRSNLYNRYSYCGADFPSIGFDGSYFFFKNLHTPMNNGNLLLTEQTDQEQAEAAADVYKMNPTQQYVNYTPTQFPYEGSHEYHLLGSADTTKNDRALVRTNRNIEPFSIFDTTTGIFIEDFGATENSWERSLFGRLGFSYEQFHSSTNNRNARITTRNNQDLSHATTNCQIEAKDSKTWNTNQFNQVIYDGTISHPQNIYVSDQNNPPLADYHLVRQLPRITQTAESLTIPARNYPIALEEGYFTIRSDIVPQSSFISGTGNTHMPVVGIVNKQTPAGDFYVTGESDMSFTVTKPQMLNSIRVQITDPDGSLAKVGPKSSVIFKLTRERQLATEVAKEVYQDFLKTQS